MIIELLPHHPLLPDYSQLFGRNVYDTSPCNGGIFAVNESQLEQVTQAKDSDSILRFRCPKCKTVITASVSSYKI